MNRIDLYEPLIGGSRKRSIDDAAFDHLRNDEVRLWSWEHGAYWRTGGSGYTTDRRSVGRWPFPEAYALVSHCGPEKRIAFELVDVVARLKEIEDEVRGALIEATELVAGREARVNRPGHAYDRRLGRLGDVTFDTRRGILVLLEVYRSGTRVPFDNSGGDGGARSFRPLSQLTLVPSGERT